MKENKNSKTGQDSKLPDDVIAIAKEILDNRGYDESIMEEPYLKESLLKLCEEKGKEQICKKDNCKKNICKEVFTKKDVEDCINVCFYHARDYRLIDFRRYRKQKDLEVSKSAFTQTFECNKTENIVNSTLFGKHLQSRHFHKQDESITDTSYHKKKHNTIILLSIIIGLILTLLCLSCQPKNEAKETASRFLNIVCGKDTGDYTRLYPHADNLRYLLHLEQYRIQSSVCIDSDKVKVRVLGEYQEGRMKMTKSYKRMLKDEKSTQKNITLFLKPKNHKDLSQGYLIYDSKGLINIDKNDSVYTYAYWNGYIQDESTDQEVARAMKICKFYVVTHNMTKGLDLKEKEEKE